MDLAPGDVFDRYTIEALLGEGGMGRVYSAYDGRLDRRVALKILLPERPSSKRGAAAASIDTSDGPARVLREARAAAAFDHPNVVAIFDVGEASGLAFIAMELVEGVSLRRYVGDADVPIARRVRWLIDVARALDGAHARGLIHRDVKPDNVMVREDGVVKVLDFGIARRIQFEIDPTAPTQLGGAEAGHGGGAVPAPGSSVANLLALGVSIATITQQGTLIGTPVYMAPEQVRGDPIDARADQYSWGVTAYEVLTGRLPFEVKRDALQFIAEIFSREPPPLRDFVPSIPKGVEAAILRALAKQPEKRFASMAKVVARLEPFASEARKPAPASDPPAHAATRSMTPFAGAGLLSRVATRRTGAIALGIGAVAVAAALLVRRGEPPSRPAPSARAPSTNAAALSAYQGGMQATRDASMDAARASLERAVALDGSFAAALLRLAITTFDASPTEARATFQRAAELRASLDEHDGALLAAMEPYIQRQPSDFAEWERRLERVVAAAPGDPDYLYWLGNARAQRGDLGAALDAYRRAATADPKFARARWAMGETQAYLGKLDLALRSLDECLDGSPGATSCLQAEGWIYEDLQRCADVEATAKRWIATDGNSPNGYDLLAKALFAEGRSTDAVEAVLAQKWARTKDGESARSADRSAPDVARARTEAGDRAALAILAGRFDEAESHARDLERAVSAETALDAHARPALLLARIYSETGRDEDAARVADDFLRRSDAYVAEPREEDFALAKDATPELLAALLRGGKISAAERDTRRAAWLGEWKGLAPAFRPYLWIHGFAKPAETADDARAALAVLPEYAPLPAFRPLTFADGDVGRVEWLAGDVGAALPILTRAAASCVALDFPIAQTRALFFLGQAREAKGETAAACAEYASVLARWGTAGARSRTGELARERARALRCP